MLSHNSHLFVDVGSICYVLTARPDSKGWHEHDIDDHRTSVSCDGCASAEPVFCDNKLVASNVKLNKGYDYDARA